MSDHGEACPRCGAAIGVYSTSVNEDQGVRIRYLRCRGCRFKPRDNKVVVPIRFAPALTADESINSSLPRRV